VSIVLRPGGDPRGALAVTLVVATAVAVALSKLLDVEIGVRWPNDVVSPAGKIAGLLAESASSSLELAHVVVGIGINVNSRAEDFPLLGPAAPASCRTLTGVEWDRAGVLADVLGTIEAYYDRFRRDGFGPLRSAYESRLVQMNRPVAFERGGGRETGYACGVAPDGALRVALDGGGEALLYNETVEVRA
jgi:BirA family biotin operon repressor/biotin-[acetyl-CoA-carboxylase] ligase